MSKVSPLSPSSALAGIQQAAVSSDREAAVAVWSGADWSRSHSVFPALCYHWIHCQACFVPLCLNLESIRADFAGPPAVAPPAEAAAMAGNLAAALEAVAAARRWVGHSLLPFWDSLLL